MLSRVESFLEELEGKVKGRIKRREGTNGLKRDRMDLTRRRVNLVTVVLCVYDVHKEKVDFFYFGRDLE